MGAGATPPGWYPDVERPGGERYWDGAAWTENRRGGDAGGGEPPAFGEAPPAYGGTPGAAQPGAGQPPPSYGAPGAPPNYGQPAFGSPQGYQPYGGFGRAYPKSSNAGLALGLSIASIFLLFCCGIGGLLAIPGTVMGWNEMKSIDRGEVDPSSRGSAKAALIIGVIVIGLFVVGIIGYIILFAVAGTT